MAIREDVLVIIGLGGMGRAACRRLGAGRPVVVADADRRATEAVATELAAEGYDVRPVVVDVTDADAVAALAAQAAGMGPVGTVVHTAGVSPVSGSIERILAVDLVGTANVLDELGAVIAPGGAGVVVASMSAHLGPPIEHADEVLLTHTPCRELAKLAVLDPARHQDPGLAYVFAKRANIARVKAASVWWGRRGARICSISPGVIATPMGQAELAGPSGAGMRAMVQASGTGRLGTAEDIAAAVEFLVGPTATFVTGIDLLVDGGVVAAVTGGQRPPAPA